MRFSLAAACLSLCMIGFSSADDAHASIRKDTNIPAERLGPALNALAQDRNFQIVYVTEEVANVHTEGAVGEFTTEEALKRLLTGTGLTYRYLDDKTVTIGSATTPRELSGSAQTTSTGSDDANTAKEGKKSASGSFRVAQVDQGKSSVASPVGSQAPRSQDSSQSPSVGLEEIIVTAQKRSERLQDVPISITVLAGDSLDRSTFQGATEALSTVLPIYPIASRVPLRTTSTPSRLGFPDNPFYLTRISTTCNRSRYCVALKALSTAQMHSTVWCGC
jgi:iron complex outermembrane recepter protein